MIVATVLPFYDSYYPCYSHYSLDVYVTIAIVGIMVAAASVGAAKGVCLRASAETAGGKWSDMYRPVPYHAMPYHTISYHAIPCLSLIHI